MKLLISALEPSANLHVEPILKALGTFELFGIFDERFGKPLLPSRAFSIMGFVDAIFKIRKAQRAIKVMSRMSLYVDKVLLIDSPAFNLPLAKAIKKINPNIEIIYYILPQVWAWKAKRVAKVEKYCDVLASILPFEQRFYNKAIYVGHPLLDEIPSFKKSFEKTGYIAFLPGSRKSEIKALMPLYRELAQKIDKKNILVIPSHFSNEEIETLYGDISGFIVSKNTYEAFLESEFAFVCSGTATLEAALIGVPFVLAYKAKWLDYMIAKRFVKLNHVGLANIIFDFEQLPSLHVELLQEEVTVENLMNAYENTNSESFFEAAKRLRALLGHGSAEAMIEIIKGTKL